MPCYRPLSAWRAPGGGVSFNTSSGYADRPLALGCGQCIGCRLDRSREWAVRLQHESTRWSTSSFLTLTYEEAPASLDRHAFPAFMKRLRKKTGEHMKYFHVGEYGELLQRPHYHAILFGYGFPDRRRWKTNGRGETLFQSDELEKTWGLGFCSLGAVTFESAAYCARYVCKKINGAAAAAHYGDREPEFMTCSKGIGEAWIHRYHSDTYRDDFVVMRGVPMPVPRYYDKKMGEASPDVLRRVQLERISSANTSKARAEASPARLRVREIVKEAALNTLARRTL